MTSRGQHLRVYCGSREGQLPWQLWYQVGYLWKWSFSFSWEENEDFWEALWWGGEGRLLKLKTPRRLSGPT